MKRAFDILCSVVGLIVMSPVFIILSIGIKLDSAGPVFFRQERIGLGFRPFYIYKFRTMVRDAERAGPRVTGAGDLRITRWGRMMRAAKLDEAPQLINVLKGEMSIVGPRPEVREFVEMFRQDYDEVLSVRPGITDYAAIEFRDEEGILEGAPDPEVMYREQVLPRKIELYRKYISEKSFTTDIKLIILTLKEILFTGGRRR